jgi:hypothetical protein
MGSWTSHPNTNLLVLLKIKMEEKDTKNKDMALE